MGGSGESLNEILSQYDEVLGKYQGTVLYVDQVQMIYKRIKILEKGFESLENFGTIVSSHIKFIRLGEKKHNKIKFVKDIMKNVFFCFFKKFKLKII